jgi:hypothetical protein
MVIRKVDENLELDLSSVSHSRYSLPTPCWGRGMPMRSYANIYKVSGDKCVIGSQFVTLLSRLHFNGINVSYRIEDTLNMGQRSDDLVRQLVMVALSRVVVVSIQLLPRQEDNPPSFLPHQRIRSTSKISFTIFFN